MSYCNVGNKPRVEITFASGRKTEYQSPISPIDVTVETGLKTFRYFDANSSSDWQPGYREAQGTHYEIRPLSYCLQGGQAITIFSNDSIILSSCMAANTLSISGGNECTLKIFNLDKIKIFEIKGQCPITFEVFCGRCKPNEIECSCKSYPGYCCIPCSEITGEIKSITAAVRGISRG